MRVNIEAAELKGSRSFEFRLAVAAIDIEATRLIDIFNAARKPTKGYQAYQDEIELHLENCTITKNDKKVVNVAEFMPLVQKARANHKAAIEAAEKLQADANKELDKEVEFNAPLIPMSLLKESDKEERFEVALLSWLMPFVEK